MAMLRIIEMENRTMPDLLSAEFDPITRKPIITPITHKPIITMQRANRLGLMITYAVYARSDGRYVVLEPCLEMPKMFLVLPPFDSLTSAIELAQWLLDKTVSLMNAFLLGNEQVPSTTNELG